MRIHAQLEPQCKGFHRYIGALLHCGKMGPKGARRVRFRRRNPRPVVVNFPDQVEGAGGSPTAGRGSITHRGDTQTGQHQRQWIHSACDGKSREDNPGDFGGLDFRLRVSARIVSSQIDNQPNDRHGFVCDLPNASSVNLNQAGERCCGTNQ